MNWIYRYYTDITDLWYPQDPKLCMLCYRIESEIGDAIRSQSAKLRTTCPCRCENILAPRRGPEHLYVIPQQNRTAGHRPRLEVSCFFFLRRCIQYDISAWYQHDRLHSVTMLHLRSRHVPAQQESLLANHWQPHLGCLGHRCAFPCRRENCFWPALEGTCCRLGEPQVNRKSQIWPLKLELSQEQTCLPTICSPFLHADLVFGRGASCIDHHNKSTPRRPWSPSPDSKRNIM